MIRASEQFVVAFCTAHCPVHPTSHSRPLNGCVCVLVLRSATSLNADSGRYDDAVIGHCSYNVMRLITVLGIEQYCMHDALASTPPGTHPRIFWLGDVSGNIPPILLRKKGKVFPYSLPSVGPGADPGVQAVSPQVT